MKKDTENELYKQGFYYLIVILAFTLCIFINPQSYDTLAIGFLFGWLMGIFWFYINLVKK